MSDFYNPLKLRMQDKLPWKRNNSVSLDRVNSANVSGLSNEMEKFERLVVDRLGKLKQAVNAGEASALEQARKAEQLADSLKAEITALNARLKEAEETIERKDLSHQRMEDDLSGKIKSLQDEMQKKNETLTARENEIRDCQSKIDDNVKKIGELELDNTKAKDEAAHQAKRAEDLAKNLQEKIAHLEARLHETEELADERASIIKELEQQLVAEAQEFENALKNKDEVLTRRDEELADVRSQLKLLARRIGKMSSLFREAEALTGIGEQDNEEPAQHELVQEVNEEHTAPVGNFADVGPATVPDALPEIVSPEIFQRIVNELAQATNVIAPLASLMVHQQAKALGASVEKFPRERLPELLEALANEITDENLQTYFREQFADEAQIAMN